MSLDNIAESIGTVTDEQQTADFCRYNENADSDDLGDLDVQNEYDGGWTNKNA